MVYAIESKTPASFLGPTIHTLNTAKEQPDQSKMSWSKKIDTFLPHLHEGPKQSNLQRQKVFWWFSRVGELV